MRPWLKSGLFTFAASDKADQTRQNGFWSTRSHPRETHSIMTYDHINYNLDHKVLYTITAILRFVMIIALLKIIEYTQ